MVVSTGTGTQKVKIAETTIPGVLLIEPEVHRDNRGSLSVAYERSGREQPGAPMVQDNVVHSRINVIRGLHMQRKRQQAKIVQCLHGLILDVAVDPVTGDYYADWLSGNQAKQMYIPAGFLHGFCTKSEESVVLYKCSDYYCPDDQVAVRWNDPDIGIPWELSGMGEPILSERDTHAGSLRELQESMNL